MFHIPKRRLSQKITLRHFSKDETRQKFQISNFEKTRQDRIFKLQILKRQDKTEFFLAAPKKPKKTEDRVTSLPPHFKSKLFYT
jgi:hypothetical protein